MDEAEFEQRVARTEAFAARRPAAYRWQVFGLAALGYLYLTGVIAVLVALFALGLASVLLLKAVAIKLVFVVGTALWMMLRALWVRLEAPTGVELTRRTAPALFQLLDRLRAQARAPGLHHVLLTPDFNAGITQVPRLGLFGWHRNYLLIGLPLMKALTVPQFEAVLAHELGHLSRGHTRAANWIYRLRLIWARLDAVFTQNAHWGALLIRPFFKRFVPYFTAVSFPLARANEYEADATSIRLSSADAAAGALTSVSVVAAYLSERYWPQVYQGAKTSAQPSFAPFSSFDPGALAQVPRDEVQAWLDVALRQKTSHLDTHPCLADRLKAMGAQARFTPPPPGAGAEALLGEGLQQWAGEFDRRWRERVSERWRQMHEQAQANRTRLGELREQAGQGELDEMRSLELANLEESEGEGPEAALALRRAQVERHPDSLPLRFALARQLLQRNDADGVAPMESVLQAEPDAVLAGTQLLRDFYARQEDRVRAKAWHQQYVERATMLQADRRERTRLLRSDHLVAHRLPQAVVADLRAELKKFPEVRRAWLARKLTTYFQDKPLYVLGFKSDRWWSLHDAARAHALTQRMSQELRFSAGTLIVNVEGGNAAFATKLRKLRGARIL